MDVSYISACREINPRLEKEIQERERRIKELFRRMTNKDSFEDDGGSQNEDNEDETEKHKMNGARECEIKEVEVMEVKVIEVEALEDEAMVDEAKKNIIKGNRITENEAPVDKVREDVGKEVTNKQNERMEDEKKENMMEKDSRNILTMFNERHRHFDISFQNRPPSMNKSIYSVKSYQSIIQNFLLFETKYHSVSKTNLKSLCV